jgi:hypothetical protein
MLAQPDTLVRQDTPAGPNGHPPTTIPRTSDAAAIA